MKIQLLFQSLLESVHDSLFITTVSDETLSIRGCYCLWVDSSKITLILKNKTNRHTIEWDMASNVILYNQKPQEKAFLGEVIRILQCISKDLVEGKARVFKNQMEAA